MFRRQWKAYRVGLGIGLWLLLCSAGAVPVHANEHDEEAARPDSRAWEKARMLHKRAHTLHHQGKHTEAIPLAEEALATLEQAPDAELPVLARWQFSLGVLYRVMGDHARAEARLLDALATWRKVPGAPPAGVARARLQLGEVYISQKRYDQAEPHIRHGLAMMEATLGPNHPDTASGLATLASLMDNAHDAQREAIALLQRALAIQEKALGPEHLAVSTRLRSLAGRHILLGEYATAEALLQRTLAIRENHLGPTHPETAKVLKKLMQATWGKGDRQSALAWARRLLEARTASLDHALERQSEEGMTHYLNFIDKEVDQVLTLALAQGDARASRLAWATLLGRKGRALQLLTSTRATLRSRGGAEARALLDAYRDFHTRYMNILLHPDPGATAEQHAARLEALLDERHALDKQASARALALGPRPPPVTIDAIQAALPRDAAFIDWVRYRPFDPRARTEQYGTGNYAACVVSAHGPPTCVDLGRAFLIEGAIRAQREAITSHLPTANDWARVVHNMLLAPLRPHLADAKHLFLSPDAALHQVPFAALLDERAKFLIERYTITHVLDGSELVHRAATAPPRSPPLVVAAPDFGTPHQDNRHSFEGLRHSLDEGRAVRDLLGATLLAGAQATETRLEEVRGPKVLHLATHGAIDWQGCSTPPRDDCASEIQQYIQRYARTGVALTGVNTCTLRGPTTSNGTPAARRNDGWLSAPELATLDLHGTRLVVLSACQTGEGLSSRDSGFFGLRRALVLAGAETHMVSLWSVYDHPTRELMNVYYRHLAQGAGRSEALREAQLEFLRESPMLREQPVYWAGFIVSGNPAPL